MVDGILKQSKKSLVEKPTSSSVSKPARQQQQQQQKKKSTTPRESRGSTGNAVVSSSRRPHHRKLDVAETRQPKSVVPSSSTAIRQPPHDSFAVKTTNTTTQHADTRDSPREGAPPNTSREQQQQQGGGGASGGGAAAANKNKNNNNTINYIGSALIESGVHHYSKGEYEKALKAFHTALKTQRVSVGENHICIALTLGNLGAVYLQQGNLDEAEHSLQASLEMKRTLEPDMIVADTLNNLGNCANLRGDYEKSLIFYRESLTDLRTKGGLRRDVANALFNIGRLEIQSGQWTTALGVLTEAWNITREVYGENTVFVAQTLELIGLVQLNTSEYDAAIGSFSGALSIYGRVHGPLHIDVANALFNVGMVREAMGNLRDAWEAYTTSRDVYVRLGTNHGHTGFRAVRRSIANVEREIAKQNHTRLIAKNNQALKHAKASTRTSDETTK